MAAGRLRTTSPEADPHAASGARIGQYELIRELGRGGMGAVYLARDTKLGRRVAIKFLHGGEPELTARFVLEARATARCNHENIVVIHEVDEHCGDPFMVLEYLQGAPLSKIMDRGRKLPPGRAVELMVPVVRALERAHEHNIVHRDLKPDNIFVTSSGTVKVLDFGIAKLLSERESHDRDGAAQIASDGSNDRADDDGLSQQGSQAITRSGALVGTLPYMSPEQWGAGEVDHRTDIWAAGIILFEMVAGKHPLSPLSGLQLLVTGILTDPMPSARHVCPEIPAELAVVIDRCLVKDRELRLGSARELLRALEPLRPSRYTCSLRIDESPYAGLSAFQEADANRFFGRSREIAAVVTRLQGQPLLGVAGPSGVGKSSFIRAGVVPALKQSGESWSSLVIRPGREPTVALAQLIAPLLSENFVGATGTVDVAGVTMASELDTLQRVRQRVYSEPGYLGTVLRSHARTSGQRLLVFIDQFEELYTLVPDVHERLAFTSSLASVADDATSPLRVVISIRSDFLDRVAEDERFMSELAHGLCFMTQPSREGLRDALIQPAEMADFAFESPATIDEMLDHLQHTPGALPLLQFAATRLWDLRDRERQQLTDASYRQIGGIAGALASHADAVLAEFSAQDQHLVRGLFLRLVTPERTRSVVSIDELGELSRDPGQVRRLIEHLVHARLLTVQTGDAGNAASVELVHESLLHSWPLLRRWLDENQDDAIFLEQLRNAARQWQTRGCPAGLLWRGEAMAEAERWHRRYQGDLPPLQREYLQAVFALDARAARRRRYAVAGVIGLLSIMVAAAAVALVLIRDAQKEASAQADEAGRQLERARVAEAAAKSERERAVAASGEVERTNQELSRKNSDLIAAVRAAEEARSEAENARANAESAKHKARRDRRHALDKERDAQEAEARAREANDRLHELLARERARIDELEEQGATTVILDVPVD